MTDTATKKCSCCPDGCTCGDCTGCTPKFCSLTPCSLSLCGGDLGKKLLCFLGAGILFACGVLVGTRHGGTYMDGKNECGMMRMMHHGKGSMRGCDMNKGTCGCDCGSSCGGSVKDTATIGQNAVATGSIATGN